MNDPSITIGLVVYNGERDLADAIQSFCDQTLRSFLLIVYDNGSTDRTPQIAARFAARDERIRLVRRPRNIGSLLNFVNAAEQATTPYFCWAAHDDRRDPTFLQRLHDLLEHEPRAHLAACGSLELDPSGHPRGVCGATAQMHSTVGLTQRQRLKMYLAHSPCSLMYGLFRTPALQSQLHVLRRSEREGGACVFGGDLVFLAAFLKQYDMAFDPKPLLMLRSGGESHRPGAFRGLLHLSVELCAFYRLLKQSTRVIHWRDSVPIALARWRLFFRYLTWPPMLRLIEDYLVKAAPVAGVVASWIRVQSAPFARLRRRAASLQPGSRVILFGAGKHTHRHLKTIRRALGRRVVLEAIGDDQPEGRPPVSGVPIISSEDMRKRRPDVVLVSSDTYEAALHARAVTALGRSCRIWCIYDIALEQAADGDSAIASAIDNSMDSRHLVTS